LRVECGLKVDEVECFEAKDWFGVGVGVLEVDPGGHADIAVHADAERSRGRAHVGPDARDDELVAGALRPAPGAVALAVVVLGGGVRVGVVVKFGGLIVLDEDVEGGGVDALDAVDVGGEVWLDEA